jgi:hypothetical protein
MTARELEELNQELLAVLLPRYRERLTDPSLRPPDAVPVEFLVLAYPIGLPPSGDAWTGGAGADDPPAGEPS